MADGLVLTRRVSERGVHDWALRPVDPKSAGAVREYVGYEEWTDQGFVRREVARCEVALILAFGDEIDVHDGEVGPEPRRLQAFVVGNQSYPSMTGVRGHQLGVQVELTAAGALALLGDVGAYNDSVVPLDEALGGPGAQLPERLADVPSWEARLDLLDSWFAAREVPTLAPEVRWLREQLVASRGQARVEPLMDDTGWSRRHVTERFRRQLGIAPKAFARLLRFQHAAALLTEVRPRRSLADVAMAAGYYDQSHLTRDFAALAGMTPGTYAADATAAPEVSFVQDVEERAPA
ncbi:MAG TPA: helix-turn-helix domain-containing protein [Acidimicrobiales bacterium]|jgi:AraC-like DNA-binding protein|nr:helix-turn-helix domain-containing protein [Acidimicrobiales bacterium]